MEFYVEWRIEVEADSPEQAAHLARQIQLDPDSTATVFHVAEGDSTTLEQIDIDAPLPADDPAPGGPVNWDLLRAHGVYIEPVGGAWTVTYTDEHGRRYGPGMIHDGNFHEVGQFPWPDGLRAEIQRLAAAMAPVVYCDVHNLAERTEQQVFDYIALRLLMQGERSTDDGGQCQLRGTANGLKCAGGWLIPDDDYRPSMENQPPSDIIGKFWTRKHDNLIEIMVSMHDVEPPESWPELFQYPHQFICDDTPIGDLNPFPRGVHHETQTTE